MRYHLGQRLSNEVLMYKLLGAREAVNNHLFLCP